jgi:hypothetical protein
VPKAGQQIGDQPGNGPFGQILFDWFGNKGDNDQQRSADLVRQAMNNQGTKERASITAQATRDAAAIRLAGSNPQAFQAMYGRSGSGQPREVYGPRRPGEKISFVQPTGGSNLQAVSTQNQILRNQAAMERKAYEAQLAQQAEQARARTEASRAAQQLRQVTLTQNQTTQRQRIISGANVAVQNDRGFTDRYKADRVFRGVNVQANARVRERQIQSAGEIAIAGKQESTKRYQADRNLDATRIKVAGSVTQERLQQGGQNYRTGLQQQTIRYQSDNNLRGVQEQQKTARYQSDNNLRSTALETQARVRVANTEAGTKRYVSDNETGTKRYVSDNETGAQKYVSDNLLRANLAESRAREYAANQQMFAQVASSQASAAADIHKAYITADPELATAYGEDEFKAIKRSRALRNLYSLSTINRNP